MLRGETEVNTDEQRAKEEQALQELKSTLKDQLKPRQVCSIISYWSKQCND